MNKKHLITFALLFLLIILYIFLEQVIVQLFSLLPVTTGTAFYNSSYFFMYEVPKVFILLVLIVFSVGIIRTFFSPERTRKLLEGKRQFAGNLLAGALGIVTPFCSCSAIPLFLGFIESGVSLGVTFSFLIAAPMINEIALVMLFGLFGWKVALLYMATGLSIAVFSGFIIGKLGMEKYLEDWVQKIEHGAVEYQHETQTWTDRIIAAEDAVKDILRKVWIYVVAGIAVGSLIHGYVPENFMASIMGKSAWWSVPVAVFMGVPMYSNAAGIIPVVQALLSKGASLGTVLAFMMSVIGLSLPELIILRKVLKLPLIFTFVAIVAAGIIMVGYLFNFIM